MVGYLVIHLSKHRVYNTKSDPQYQLQILDNSSLSL